MSDTSWMNIQPASGAFYVSDEADMPEKNSIR